MAKLAQREKAQKLALQGNIDAALTELMSLEAAGNLAANVSLVEIAAYKGSWQEVMERVELLFGTPDWMITQNVVRRHGVAAGMRGRGTASVG